MPFVTEGYTFVENLRSGAFGSSSVFRKDDDKQLYVIKIIPRDNTRRYAVEKEYRLMKRAWKAGCTTIPQPVGLWEDGENYGIIMEYLREYVALDQWCELYDVSTKQMALVARSLVQAVECLHAHNIYHRDISTMNVMVLPDDDGKIKDIRIIDMGLSCYRTSCLVDSGFNLYYSHPEWIRKITDTTKTAEDIEMFQKYDMWSIGMVVVAMANGGIHPFFPDMKDADLHAMIFFWFSPLVRHCAKSAHLKWSRIVKSLTGRDDLLQYNWEESTDGS